MHQTYFLNIKGLSVEFRTRNGTIRAVDDINFHLSKGEFLGIVGESGSGKSVTAYSVMGLLDSAGHPVCGQVMYDGIDIIKATENTMQDIRGREISMIFQNPRAALNPIRPVGYQIEDVLKQHQLATRQTAKLKAVELLRQVKIFEPELRYKSYPFELSGGMCQRVMIAIALACSPRLLIADEPTTGLDTTTQKATMDLVKELALKRNMAVIVISHDLGLVSNYCNRLVVMESGKIVETASVNDLLACPKNEYSKKLIAASPKQNSCLEDLTISSEKHLIRETFSHLEKKISTSQLSKIHTLLDVRNLTKDFPIRNSFKNFFFRQTNSYHSKSYRAVDDVSFKLESGQSLGLVGESGCGKSTTSKMISRLINPTSGEVFFKGTNITNYDAKDFVEQSERRMIQMVFQDPTDSLNPRYTAHESIAEPLKLLLGMKDSHELQLRICSLADQVGLSANLLDRFPHQLSGGQKARVGIARAISVKPQLLILDEPTSSLDVSVQAIILQLLNQLKNVLGMSYIFVSHDLNVVRLMCDRVIVMNQGKIVESGKCLEVFNSPKNPYTKALVEAIPCFEK